MKQRTHWLYGLGLLAVLALHFGPSLAGRNGSGTYSIPNTFSSGQVITSSGMNGNFSDIANEITNSVAVDGQSTMTGPLKLSNGSAAAPAVTFGADTDTGFYRKGANQLGFAAGGTELGYWDSTGLTINGAVAFTTPLSTSNYANSSVTYAKVQNVTAARLLGNPTGSAAAPSEISLGSGLSFNSTTLNAVCPPAGLFKNLVIKVTGNTAATVTADSVVTSNGTTCQTTAVNSTLNLATTGADALDAGAIASATWYAVWVIAKPDGTTASLVSTSYSSPTMPTGYTYKARVGSFRTASAAAQLLGTWQFGRQVQYKNGLAALSTLPSMSSGTSTGDISIPTWSAVAISNFFPNTAAQITVVVQSQLDTATVIVAPNNSYGAFNSATNPPPLTVTKSMAVPITLIPESTNIYAAADNNYAIWAIGWEEAL